MAHHVHVHVHIGNTSSRSTSSARSKKTKGRRRKSGTYAGAKAGSGKNFAALSKDLSRRKGVTNPGALAAYIGRKKYGNARFQSMAAKGRRNAGRRK